MGSKKINLKIEKFSNLQSLAARIAQYNFPTNITAGMETPVVFPRTIDFKNEDQLRTCIVGLCNLKVTTQADNYKVLLDPFLIASNDTELVFFIHESSHNEKEIYELINAHSYDSHEAVIAAFLLQIYSNYRTKLSHIKDQLEQLEANSSQTTKNEELIQLKNIKKDTVILEHTLETQHQALEHLFKLDEFSKNLTDQTVIYNIKTAERQITKLVEVYRDLIDAISGLFSDIMSNHLNHLMKYLDSAALVISIPTLIAGLWGMNTGGLPGRHSEQGFLLMLLVSGVFTIVAWIILRFKKFND